MVKKIALSVTLLAILVLCFIPVTLQKNVTIKTPFLNLYSILSKPENWERYRPEFRKAMETDSANVHVSRTPSGFVLTHDKLQLGISQKAGYFDIREQNGNNSDEYAYLLIPGKQPEKTTVIAYKPSNGFGFVLNKLGGDDFSGTHIAELKNFIETDSVYFGLKISKVHIPTGYLIVANNKVLTSDRFKEAGKLADKLNRFIISHKVKKMRPVIAQFGPIVKDSTAVKVGYFIDQDVKPADGVEFNGMPVHGWLFVADYSGRFNKRWRVYDAMNRFYLERGHQTVIRPFEMYMDDRLPTSDTDKILMRVNFSAFP